MNQATIAQQIVDTIVSNRISTTEVADALGKRGVINGMLPLADNFHRVGVVRPVFAAGGSNHAVHEQVRDVAPHEVVVIYTQGCEGRAIIGDLITKYVTLYRRGTAIVVNGMVRDAARIRRERYPVWSQGVSPLGCVNTPSAAFAADEEARIRDEVEGGIAVCDDGGVVIIPRRDVTQAMLERLHGIELQEDLWYYCLDVLKWDTKKIVCDKAYLREPGVLPEAYARSLQSLERCFGPQPATK
jgi:4-hydroxy-4-methyl-2-oxoglutarate aldolase